MKCKHCKHQTECADDAFINGAEFDLDVEHECAGFVPFTNADRIRAMNNAELAEFVAAKIVNLENHKMVERGYTPTATQLHALGTTMYGTMMAWLQRPAEGE